MIPILRKVWSNERFLQQLNTYHAARHTHISEDGLTIHQTHIDLNDLNDLNDRAIYLTLDPEKSNETRTPVLHLESIVPI